jgi:hypothetical protein
MATTRAGGRYVLPANADLSAKQYYIVKRVAGGKVDLCTAGGDNSLGVLQNTPVANDSAEVLGRHSSETGKVIAGASITRGDKLTSNASGKAVATTTEDDHVFGIAESDAANNDIIEYTPVFEVVPPAS